MDQKLENILNLALETPEEEREQTESLNVGYSAEIRSWELIVKYHGNLDRLREQNIVVEELIALRCRRHWWIRYRIPRRSSMWKNPSGFIMDRRFLRGHPVFHRSL